MNKNKNYAYMGKSLRINLSTGEIKTCDYSSYFNDWLGGSGFAAKLLYDELKDWHTPYDPMNKMIFSSGALLGTFAPGACKMSVSTLGPVTGGWATGSSDSHIGLELKHAGYDDIIVEGRSHRPCYLLITDEKVEIRDAQHLWGLTTSQTLEAIRKELKDNSLHLLSIGPAGENLSRNACIIQDKNRAMGRCGSGAVMGSKNLKAIVCKGSKPIEIAQPDRFFKKVIECRERINSRQTTKTLGKYGTPSAWHHKQNICGIPYKNFQECRIPDDIAKNLNPMDIIDKYQVTRQGFPGCVICCGRQVHVTEGPYKGLNTFMNQWEIIGAIMGKLGVKTGEFMLAVNDLCNDLGLDVDVAGGAIGWAMECYDRGILTKEDTGGIEIKWGDEQVILKLIEMMSYRKGFGNLLAEGSARAAEILGRGSDYYAIHVKKQDLYELMRSSNGWCLGTAVSTRGGGHTTGTPNCEQSGLEIDDEMSLKILGVPGALAVDPAAYEGKAKIVYYHEILHRACNCLGICIFNTIHMDMNYLNLEDIAELLSAATGEEFTTEKLEEIAMRQLNMEKAINLRFTDFARKDDYPPARELNEPIPKGSRKGWKIDKEKYDRMLDEYYDMHGWDKKTSYPTRKAYEKYGLSYVADDMERIGKLGAE